MRHVDELHQGLRLTLVHLELGVPREATEVALALDKRIARREVLREPHKRVVDRGIAVRVVLPHHVPDDCRRFAHRAIVAQSHLVHRVKDPALYRLQPVANVG